MTDTSQCQVFHIWGSLSITFCQHCYYLYYYNKIVIAQAMLGYILTKQYSYIINAYYRAVVSAILQNSSWKQGLRVCYPSHINKENQKSTSSQQSRGTTNNGGNAQENESINYGTTPFRELIKSMPGTVILWTLKCNVVNNLI